MHKLVLTIYFEQYLPCTQETILFTRQKSPRIKTQWQYFLLGEKISAGVKNPYEEKTLQLLQFALEAFASQSSSTKPVLCQQPSLSDREKTSCFYF